MFYNKNKLLIGLLLMSILVIFYSYFTDKPIKLDQLEIITGTLKEKPYISETKGDMPKKYIYIKLEEDDNFYYLMECAYNMSKKQMILDLSNGDSLIIWHKSDFINKDIHRVYKLLNNEMQLLNLTDYNNCYTSEWKLLLPITMILLVILVFRFMFR